ncbi:MAG: potassium-transporting ATPase subunit KdpA, partial [Nevskia sp.]|nr:potassium-transporting ATPase subunit KdpA [Nevskia sp.]
MTINGWAQILVYFVLLTLLTRPLGGFLYRVFEGQPTLVGRLLGPLERGFYRLAGVDPQAEQHWTRYTLAMLVFNLVCFVTLYLLQLYQNRLPLNPQNMSGLTPDLAFNTAMSFVTNTNWQAYGGESTMSYLTQMLGLTVHNFVSAATGIALAVALVRGFSRRSAKSIGNFWVDLTRATLYVLLPMAIVAALLLVWQGMPQNLHAYTDVATLEGGKQTIAQGPVASQIAIKMFGTNGGGFFNANAAQPFENPTALCNFVQMVSIFALGAALT